MIKKRFKIASSLFLTLTIILSSANSINVLCCDMEDQLVDYFTQEKISKAQEEAFEITKQYFGKTSKRAQHFSMLKEISSNRNFFEAGLEKTTDLEKLLDNAVQNGDLPIKSFTLDEIKKVKDKYIPNPALSPEYTIVQGGYDAIDLHKIAADGAIVQVASQYNALESIDCDFSPVKEWFLDKTQGPMACLQAVAATKHRESAALQEKLPDAIKDLLENCMVPISEESRDYNIKITDKYPNLYCNGYLQPTEVGDKNLTDLIILTKYIKENKSKLGFNSQWVKCEGSGKKQLQVFNAAPSFQFKRDLMNWNDKTDKYTKLYSKICKYLVVEQYRAIAQVAAIKSAESGKTVELHLCQIGQGAFYNPLEIMPQALTAVNSELQGFDVKVYLYEGRGGGRARSWYSITQEI